MMGRDIERKMLMNPLGVSAAMKRMHFIESVGSERQLETIMAADAYARETPIDDDDFNVPTLLVELIEAEPTVEVFSTCFSCWLATADSSYLHLLLRGVLNTRHPLIRHAGEIMLEDPLIDNNLLDRLIAMVTEPDLIEFPQV